MDIALYTYRFVYRYTVLLYNLYSWLYLCVDNSNRWGTHTHTHTWTLHFIHIDSCTDILYYCTQPVQMDCTLWTQLYNAAQLDSTYISCTPVCLYCSPVTVLLFFRTWWILTNESPSKITFMNLVNQSQLRLLRFLTFHPPSLQLNCDMLATALLPCRMGCGQKK